MSDDIAGFQTHDYALWASSTSTSITVRPSATVAEPGRGRRPPVRLQMRSDLATIQITHLAPIQDESYTRQGTLLPHITMLNGPRRIYSEPAATWWNPALINRGHPSYTYYSFRLFQILIFHRIHHIMTRSILALVLIFALVCGAVALTGVSLRHCLIL